jgi:putative inorganic carbon (HCO3(-)) transporter
MLGNWQFILVISVPGGSKTASLGNWKAALLIIRDHLFLGTGPDSFNTLYRPTAPNSYALKALDGQPFPAAYNPTLSHPHNFFLDFWISTGLLGIAALFWLLGAFVVVLIRTYRLCTPLRQGKLFQRLLLGVAGSVIVSFVHGLVDNSYFVPDLAMMFWLFIGILLIVQGIAQREQASLQDREKPIVATRDARLVVGP